MPFDGQERGVVRVGLADRRQEIERVLPTMLAMGRGDRSERLAGLSLGGACRRQIRGEDLVEFDGAVLPADLHPPQRPTLSLERRAQTAVDPVRDQEVGVKGTGQALDPSGRVDAVGDAGEVEAIGGADEAEDDRAVVNPDADPRDDNAVWQHCEVLLGEAADLVDHRQRSTDRVVGVAGEEGHQTVAHELVDDPALLVDRRDDRGEEGVDEGEGLARAQLLGEAGERAEIDEEHRDIALTVVTDLRDRDVLDLGEVELALGDKALKSGEEGELPVVKAKVVEGDGGVVAEEFEEMALPAGQGRLGLDEDRRAGVGPVAEAKDAVTGAMDALLPRRPGECPPTPPT